MNKILLILSFTLASVFAFSQTRPLTGKVTDAGGQGLPGVTVLIKGTVTGTTTNIDGNYNLNVENGKTLVFSFMGFVTREVLFSGQDVINITLTEDSKLLDEVVVVGYGFQRRKDITTAVAVVDDKALKDRPIVT
ncbi:MAG TPA: carboxypeptidase-like regulatory domain-containing protein, partial [Lentimicrobium sp.]|nr:carboxypeptidase-like regulatory domain-containing protein [Lentimicrobium sp.]